MKLISHRGNIDSPNIEQENHPDYVLNSLKCGYDVEIDVWYTDNKWFLGHDYPTYEVEFSFLLETKFWLHAKNGDAFNKLLNNSKANVFWHTIEDWVLTSKKYIWTYPNKFLYPNSICVLPELGYNGDLKNCKGICSDFISKYEKI